jgi:ABC-type nitrate/sulfonate/bicarbonate transport system permease component
VKWAGAATLVGLVALWQAGDSLGLVPTLLLPSPASIGTALDHPSVSGELWRPLAWR